MALIDIVAVAAKRLPITVRASCGGALANQSNNKDSKQVKLVHVWAFRPGSGGGRSRRFLDNSILLSGQSKRL